MNKLKVGVIFGGMSNEHDISVMSGKTIIDNLDKNKYDVFLFFIDKNGKWFSNDKEISNIIESLKFMDVVFPILHGKYGEDGTIQGMLEMFGIPYVGCGVLSSSLAMDKVYTKVILEKAGIKQANYVYLKKHNDKYIYIDKVFNEEILSLTEAAKKCSFELGLPLFVKPSRAGSSVGVNKAKSLKELEKYIEYASRFDDKILVEETLKGKEIECAVLGDNDAKASSLGQIIPSDSFYSFDAKYNSDSSLIIPADISEDVADEVKRTAIKAFKAIDAVGLARADFFVDGEDIYLSEINTMPGFTKVSMYPKLWEYDGISLGDLLDKLIDLAIEKTMH